jgi:hypothetical protein
VGGRSQFEGAPDLYAAVRLTRAAGGFPAGTPGTVADVWCEGRCLVEVVGRSGPTYVEVEAIALELLEDPSDSAPGAAPSGPPDGG